MATLIVSIATAHADEVWVFTAAGAPTLSALDRADRHFVLRQAEASLDALTFPNPGSTDAAHRMALAQIRSPQGKALFLTIRQTSEALLMAFMFGIERLPAVLVDGRYVVYGERDVQTALDSIAAYRRHDGQ